MRVLFIYPNLYAQIGFNYGIAFLSAILKKKGHTTSLLNINEKMGYPLDLDRIRKDIEKYNPGIVGISAVTNQFQYALEIAQMIKRYFTIPIVCGGIHATITPEEVLNSGYFDYLCVGEGEHALLELVEKLEKGEDTSSIANIWLRQNGKIIKNKVRSFVDLNSLPAKDYTIFNFQQMIDAKNGWVGIMSSRGCPFKCSYCFNHQMVNIYKTDLKVPMKKLQYIRHHHAERMIEELSTLLNDYKNIRMFILDDDLFTLNKEYLSAFCKEYKKHINKPFVVNGHIKFFDDERAHILKEARCEIVKFGLESGSERIRKEVLYRPMKDREIIKAFEIAHKHDLHTSAFVIFGLPYETREDLLMTIKLLAHIKPGRFRWSIFFPYINTAAYEISKEGGFIDFEKMRSLSNFTEESCLNFGERHNLWIKKLQKVLPWYVNAYTDYACSSLYRPLIQEVEHMSATIWEEAKTKILSLDEHISQLLILNQKEHYAIKYNEFMAVHSNWFRKKEWS